jgi:hypothetical protein
MDRQHTGDLPATGAGLNPGSFDPQAICLQLQLSPSAHRQICVLGLGEIARRVQALADWPPPAPCLSAPDAASLERLLHGLASSLQLAGDAVLGAALRALELGLHQNTCSPEQALGEARALLPALQRTQQALARYVAEG